MGFKTEGERDGCTVRYSDGLVSERKRESRVRV